MYISSKNNEPLMILEYEPIGFSFIVWIVNTLIPRSPVIPCFPIKSFAFLITQLELGIFITFTISLYIDSDVLASKEIPRFMRTGSKRVLISFKLLWKTEVKCLWWNFHNSIRLERTDFNWELASLNIRWTDFLPIDEESSLAPFPCFLWYNVNQFSSMVLASFWDLLIFFQQQIIFYKLY